ncbi:hypothetical protein FRC09_000069 [Ceratobasidium sp. 395]|nr:hypothetical protein FRC09_000069 [Ceratobasidium sp. 395]
MSADFDIQGGRTTVWEVRKAPLGMPTTSHLATFLGMNHLGANHMPARLNTLWRIPDSNTLILADAIHLEEVLGAEGNKLYWGGKNFHELAKKVETTGNLVSDPDAEVPKVALEVTFDHGWDSINLSGILELNPDHSVTALVPTLIEVRRQHLEEVTKIMDAYLTQHAKGMQVVRVSPPTSGDVPVEGETWYTTAKSGTQDVAFGVKAHTAEAKAVVTHLTGKHFEGDFLSVEASAHAEPLGYFAEAGAYGAKVKYGGLELDGGLAVGVGAGIKDGSVTVEAGIFDITVGKKMGAHILGFGFSGEVCTIM